MKNIKSLSNRRAVIVSLNLLIAFAHIVGFWRYFPEDYFKLFQSYFSDLIMPFGFYFLLCIDDQWLPFIKHWKTKLAIMFLLPTIAETCQYFGIPVLGITFDPVDYLMYALGSAAAALVDIQVFSRLFRFWKTEKV